MKHRHLETGKDLHWGQSGNATLLRRHFGRLLKEPFRMLNVIYRLTSLVTGIDLGI
jgi:hypothetical protein